MIKKEVLKFHDASANDLEYPIENVHHIIHLFKKRDFLVQYSDKDSLLKITTPFGKWKMLTDRRPIRILHINLYHERNNENVYHQQSSTFRTLFEAYRYIVKHEYSMISIAQGKVVARFNANKAVSMFDRKTDHIARKRAGR